MGDIHWKTTYPDGANVRKADIRNSYRDFIIHNLTIEELRATVMHGTRGVVVGNILYQLDPLDGVSEDDGINCIVSADGGRYKSVNTLGFLPLSGGTLNGEFLIRINDNDIVFVGESEIHLGVDSFFWGNSEFNGPVDIPRIPEPGYPEGEHCRFFALNYGGAIQPFYRDPDGNEFSLKGWEEVDVAVIDEPVASVDFLLPREYAEIVVVATGVAPSASGPFSLYVAISDDGGNTFEELQGRTGSIFSSSVAGTSITDVTIYSDPDLLAGTDDICGRAHFYLCDTTSGRKVGVGNGASMFSQAISFSVGETVGLCDRINYIQVGASSGVLNAGVIKVYGRMW